MEMKINRLSLVAISLAVLAASACSGKKPAASIPAAQKTPPPPIQATSKPAANSSVAVAKDPAPAAKAEAPHPAQTQAKPAPPADPVTDLIAQVEKLYQAGQQEYASSH